MAACRKVEFPAADGVRLRGLFYGSEDEDRPCIIMSNGVSISSDDTKRSSNSGLHTSSQEPKKPSSPTSRSVSKPQATLSCFTITATGARATANRAMRVTLPYSHATTSLPSTTQSRSRKSTPAESYIGVAVSQEGT